MGTNDSVVGREHSSLGRSPFLGIEVISWILAMGKVKLKQLKPNSRYSEVRTGKRDSRGALPE